MKRTHLLLLLTSLLLLSFVRCSDDNGQILITDGKIYLEVIMPEDISVEGVKGSLSYYWNEDLSLNLILSQEGKERKMLSLKPENIPAEGKKVNFEILLNQEEFDLNKPLTIQGAVVIGEGDLISIEEGKLFAPKGYGSLLPYDILKELNQPLLFEKSTLSLKDYKCEVSTTLKSQGQLIFLQIHNGSNETIIPKTVSFSSNENVFPYKSTTFIASKGDFGGEFSNTSINFEFPKDESLSPELATNYIVWIPSNNLKSLSVKMSHTTVNGLDTDIESPEPSLLSNVLPLIFINLTSDGNLEVGDEPVIEEADTSEGGDPYFSMNDIEFWVGNGQNRAALVIEWHDDKQPDAIVWGYRWDGEKTGYDMVKAIIAADPRLSAVLGKAFGGLEVVGGYGYQFKITKPRAHVLLDGEKLANDGNGITYVDNAKNFDNYTFSDSEGHWKSGWYTNGYWVYYTKDNRLDSWSYSQVVYSLRDLEDGCWDGWSFQDGMESFTGRPHGDKFRPAPLPNEEIVKE